MSRPHAWTGQLLSSYVQNPESGKWWSVSTISRASSAMVADLYYDETIVWEWFPDKRERGEMLECVQGSPRFHFAICEHLLAAGELPKEPEE